MVLRPNLSLSMQFADKSDRAALPRYKVKRWLQAALRVPAEITIRLVDEAEGLALNREYRGQDHATNVLTFDYARQPCVLADLVLCTPVVRHEAAVCRIELQAHYAHLIVHGALHAQGMDHLLEVEAREMESAESAILLALGYPDPYAH